MENPFASQTGGVSLKEDAQRRAMMTGGGSFQHAVSTSPYGSNSSDLGSSGYQSAAPSSPNQHPLFEDNKAPCFSSPDMASQARRDWRQHGENLTQTLEDKRRQTEHQLLNGSGLMRKEGALVVRVVSAEERIDLAGQKYTSYVIRLQFQGNNNTVNSNLVEHRYSEFLKINDLCKKHGVVMDKNAAFPAKSWAGRVGNWTPSLSVAPARHNELVNYRVIQLDCWLVHIVNLYNQGTLPAEVAQALYEFLAAPSKPPCENTNEVSIAKWQWNWNNPITYTMGSGIRQATRTVQYMCQDPYKLNQSDQSIPLDLLQAAKGLLFMTVAKAGLIVSGRIGTGLLVARMDDDPTGNIRWSAPCAVGTVGMGWGALAGADVTHYLVVLTTTKAVQDMCSGKSVQLGAEMGVAVGPIGRGANSHLATGDWTLHPAYAYAHSTGLFVGISMEGSVISVRNDVNVKFYGQQVESKALINLAGPKAAEPLYQALDTAMKAHIPEEGFRPSSMWKETKNVYENHPQRPVYTNQQSPMPPPVLPGGQMCFGSSSHVVHTPPNQHGGSGSMESYNQTSTIIPGGDNSMFASTRQSTIHTTGQGPQALFDATSPTGSGTNNRQW